LSDAELDLKYCIKRNFAANLFSIYDPTDPAPVFQIDANLAYPAAVMVCWTIKSLFRV